MGVNGSRDIVHTLVMRMSPLRAPDEWWWHGMGDPVGPSRCVIATPGRVKHIRNSRGLHASSGDCRWVGVVRSRVPRSRVIVMTMSALAGPDERGGQGGRVSIEPSRPVSFVPGPVNHIGNSGRVA